MLLSAFANLLRVDSLWLAYPYLCVCTAISAPILSDLLTRAGINRLFALVGGVIASSAALVYAYAYMGSIKEITALPLILGLGLIAIVWGRLTQPQARAITLPALVVAGGISAIGLPFSAWAGLALGVAFVGLGVHHGIRIQTFQHLPRSLVLGLLVVAISALPTSLDLGRSIRLAGMLSATNASLANDPGNLLRPLRPEQMLGIWLTGTHRVDPPEPWFRITYIGIGLVATLILVGLIHLVAVRQRIVVAWLVGTIALWVVLSERGTTWTDAKVLMLTSPIVMIVAIIGAYSLTQWRKAVGGSLCMLCSVGVLLSDAFTYHDTNLLPTERYRELLRVGERMPENARTLVPEFDEYALYALRRSAVDGPGFASKPEWMLRLRDGSITGYGMSYDLDSLPDEVLARYGWIVKRRRPDVSRPPSTFRLVWVGRYYEVWRRNTDGRGARRVLMHLPLGAEGDPGGQVKCEMLRAQLARVGRRRQTIKLVGAPVPEMVRLDPRRAALSPNWTLVPQGVALNGPGTLTARVRLVSDGRWLIWVGGNVSRRVAVLIDGRRIGEVSYESGNAGNYLGPIEDKFTKGVHSVTLLKGGGSLRPGDNAYSEVQSIVVSKAREGRLLRVPASEARRLCGKRLDWLEVVGG